MEKLILPQSKYHNYAKKKDSEQAYDMITVGRSLNNKSMAIGNRYGKSLKLRARQ